MREIKFRAFHKKFKVMVEADVIMDFFQGKPFGVYKNLSTDPTTAKQEIYNKEFINLFTCDDFELLQFTGLKDKNGVDIYEGDIVEWFTKGDQKERAQVSWWSYPGHWGWWPNNINYMKIIGNIYENPELLKQTNVLEEAE